MSTSCHDSTPTAWLVPTSNPDHVGPIPDPRVCLEVWPGQYVDLAPGTVDLIGGTASLTLTPQEIVAAAGEIRVAGSSAILSKSTGELVALGGDVEVSGGVAVVTQPPLDIAASLGEVEVEGLAATVTRTNVLGSRYINLFGT